MGTPEQGGGVGVYLFQTLDNEFPTPGKILAAVPADQQDFKLGEKGRTTAELMWHMVQSDRGFGEGIASLKLDSFNDEGAPPKTAAEIVAAFDRDVVPLLERGKSLPPEKLSTPGNVKNFPNLPGGTLYAWGGES